MLIIGNGAVVTRDRKRPYIENGAVVTDGSTIAAVGNYESLKNIYVNAEFIDAHHGLIMPAFINTHEHIYSALARGLSIKGYAPKGFLDILSGLWWTVDRNLDNNLTYLSALATYIECIKNGVTTIFDHHASYGEIPGSLFAIERAARLTGIRSCLCFEISDRDGKEKMKQAVKENVDFANHAVNDESGMIAGMMGLHASFTLSDETLAYCQSQKPAEIGYHIHVAENILDLQLCLQQHGKRIVDRLYDWDILGSKTLLAHCIYVNPHEIDLMKDTDSMVVHNPESNMGNACGCPPTMAIYHRGILTGLGTDGYTHDMLESWKVANVLHKHYLCDPNAAWAEVPAMLFDGNAKIANRYFKKKLGVLETDASADIIITDYLAHTPMNADNINSHILFGMNGRSVITTIANGKILMQDRQIKVLDEEAAMAQTREGTAVLARRINAE